MTLQVIQARYFYFCYLFLCANICTYLGLSTMTKWHLMIEVFDLITAQPLGKFFFFFSTNNIYK